MAYFEVTMDDVGSVENFKSFGDLNEDLPNFPLRNRFFEFFPIFDKLIKVSIVGEFCD